MGSSIIRQWRNYGIMITVSAYRILIGIGTCRQLTGDVLTVIWILMDLDINEYCEIGI